MPNSDDSHFNRMASIGKVALPDPDSPLYDEHVKKLEHLRVNNPALNKELKKRYKKARAIASATIRNGAGYVADQVLRHFYFEYVDRAFNVGLRTLPASFNIMEAFFNYEGELNVFRILPEKDYLISVEDFLDFATGNDSPKEDVSAAYNLPENVIHNYTAFDDPRSCMFSSGDSEEFGISSVSMVRRGDELSVILVAGKSYHLDEKNKIIELAKSMTPTKPSLEKYINETSSEIEEWDITHPENSPELWQHILLVRFNLKTKTHSARYLMKELSRGLIVLHDDPDLPLPSGMSSSVDELDSYSTLFDLAKTSILIPAYIDYRVTYIRSEDVNTNFGKELSNSLKKKRDAEVLNSNERVLIRKISAVRIIKTSSTSAIGRAYTPPTFEVSISGFWRYFANKEWVGKDENGHSVLGKTWVKPHSRYKDNPNTTHSPKIVYLKSRIPNQLHTNVKSKSQKENEQTNKLTTDELAQTSGTKQNLEYLYVMVNPAHKTGLFKVGYTTRTPEERARELSSNTGSPAHYLVVESWHVQDGKDVEKKVHRELEKYRLSGNREFFQVDYSVLRKIITSIISCEQD